MSGKPSRREVIRRILERIRYSLGLVVGGNIVILVSKWLAKRYFLMRESKGPFPTIKILSLGLADNTFLEISRNLWGFLADSNLPKNRISISLEGDFEPFKMGKIKGSQFFKTVILLLILGTIRISLFLPAEVRAIMLSALG